MGNLRQKFTDKEWEEINLEIENRKEKSLIEVAKKKLENAKTRNNTTKSR